MFKAPEFYNTDDRTFKVDVWALGCIMHQMLFGSHPFQPEASENRFTIIEKVRNDEYKIPSERSKSGSKIDEYMIHALLKCLVKNPKDRISIEELRNHKAFDTVRGKFANELGQDKQNWFISNLVLGKSANDTSHQNNKPNKLFSKLEAEVHISYCDSEFIFDE